MNLGTLKNRLKSKFVGDTLILQCAAVVQVLSGLVLSAVLARQLGPKQFGTYALIYILYRTLYSFVIVGVGPGTMAHYSNAWMHRDRSECLNVLAFYFKSYFISHFVACVLGVLLAEWVSETFYNNPEVGTISRLLFFDGMLLGFYALTGIVYQATRMMKQLAFYEAFESLFRTTIMCSLVLLGVGLQGIVIAHVSISLLMSIFGVLMYRRSTHAGYEAFPEFGSVWKRIWSVRISDYISVGFKIRFGETITQWNDLLPQNLLGMIARPEDVGFFRLAINIVKAPDFLFRALTRSLLPKLYEMKANDGFNTLYKKYWVYSCIFGVGSALFYACYVLLLPYLILLIYGDNYKSVSDLSMILIIALVFSGFAVFARQVLIVLNRQGIYLGLIAVSFLVWAGGGYLLIRQLYSYGAALYYIGMQLTVVFSVFIICGLYLKKHFRTVGQNNMS